MPDGDDVQRRTDEFEFVMRAQRGDDEAFQSLVEIYDRRLLYFVRRLLGETEEAYDVVQTVWLMVLRGIARLSAPAAFRVWLYRIAHAQAVTVLRRRNSTSISADDLPAENIASEERDADIFENAELVHDALRDLSVDHRRVLVLRFLEDMPVEEIAAVLESPPGTIKSRLHYAKAALRQRIEELNHD